MLENLQNIEQITLFFAPLVLIIPGIIGILIGLCVWLGGLRWNRLIATLTGASGGAILIYLFTEGHIISFGLAILITAGFTMMFQRASMVLTGALITMMISVFLFTDSLQNKDPLILPAGYQTSSKIEALMLTPQESLQYTTDILLPFFCKKILPEKKNMSLRDYVLVISTGVLIIVLGIFATRLVIAATSSTVGTVLISFGMILLLLYKGAGPLTGIYQKHVIYFSVAAAMIGFGIIVELLLSPPKHNVLGERKQKKEEE